eukprot:scaffold3607_cov114-Isochrysis_galbana.AAC.9
MVGLRYSSSTAGGWNRRNAPTAPTTARAAARVVDMLDDAPTAKLGFFRARRRRLARRYRRGGGTHLGIIWHLPSSGYAATRSYVRCALATAIKSAACEKMRISHSRPLGGVGAPPPPPSPLTRHNFNFCQGTQAQAQAQGMHITLSYAVGKPRIAGGIGHNTCNTRHVMTSTHPHPGQHASCMAHAT